MTAVSVQLDDSRPVCGRTLLAGFPLLKVDVIICPENLEPLSTLLG